MRGYGRTFPPRNGGRRFWERGRLAVLATIAIVLVAAMYYRAGIPPGEGDDLSADLVQSPPGPDFLLPSLVTEGPSPGGEGEVPAGSPDGRVPDGFDPEVTETAGPASPPPSPPKPGEMVLPINGKVLAGYGMGWSATMEDFRMHNGIDIQVTEGAPVQAAAAGKVASVRRSSEWEWTVSVDHGGGIISVYAGLGAASVSTGQTVTAGDTLGRAGSGGLREAGMGLHLHFEVWSDGVSVDPEPFLN